VKSYIGSKTIVYAAISIIAFLLLWQLISGLGFVNSHLFPPPTKVFTAFIEWAKSGDLANDFFTSIWRVMVGLILGSFIGISIGLFTGRNKVANSFLSPLMNVFRAFPPVALLPVFITFFGIGNFSKVFSIAVASIFPIWINTHIGSSSVPVEYLRSAKLLTQSQFKTFFKIILPASLPQVIAGFRISLSISFIMLYVSELAGASNGLGYEIMSSQLAYRMDLMFASLITLGCTAAIFDSLFNMLAGVLFPWIKLNKQ
jgi:ABC-type nitrate/sulfonate/bicarbonate transport system permease component